MDHWFLRFRSILSALILLLSLSASAFRSQVGFFKTQSLVDPYWANVVLLLRCDGGQLYDVKNHFFTNYGVTSSVLNSKFGIDSCYFDGSSYLAFGNQADFNVGSGDFTVEGWVYDANGASNGYIATASRYSGGGHGFFLGHDYALTGDQQGGGAGIDEIIPSPFVSVNNWHHVAYVRNGGTLNYYIDGVSAGTTPATVGATWGNLVIGRLSPDQNSYYFTGNMEEMRVTKGVARYTSSFNVPTSPFPIFAPNQLPGLKLWLDANDVSTITESAGALSQWNDKSSSGLIFTQSTAGKKPVYDTAHTTLPKNAVSVNAATKFVQSSSLLNVPANHTIFYAGYWYTAGSNYTSLAMTGGSAANAIQSANNTGAIFLWSSPPDPDGGFEVGDTAFNYSYKSSLLTTNTSFLAAFVSDGVPANFSIRHNRSAVTLAATGYTGPLSLDTVGAPDTFYLGNGAFGEILIYNRTLTLGEIQMVEEYLRNKWGTP